MNKKDLIETLAAKNDLSKAPASRVLDTLLETITTAVAKKQDVTLFEKLVFMQSRNR